MFKLYLLPLEGDILKILHSAIKENEHPHLAIY
jgi:hypothetical protein